MSRIDSALRQLTLANQLTLLRLAAVPAFALALLNGRTAWAFWIFVGASITDRLDGIAARRLGQQTALGAYLDPAADKLLMLATYVILALPQPLRSFPDFQLAHPMPAALTLIVVARDVVIVVVALGLFLAYGETKFAPLRIGKWATACEMGAGALYLLANVWDGVPDVALTIAAVATVAFGVGSAVAYLLRTSHAQRSRGEGGDES